MSEHKMTKKDQEEKEDIVKGMKKNFSDFRKRYGKDAKDVMYATATKMAMKKEDVDSPNQYIDKKLYHDIFGEGLVLNDFSQINEQGKIDWYSVKFNHGIETAFTEDIEEMIDRYNQINEIDLRHSDPKKHARSKQYHYDLGKKTAQAGKEKGETSDSYGPYASDYESGYHSVKNKFKPMKESHGGLHGGQHKIDANKNNKIDSHDFKLLRRLKKARS